MEAKLTLWTAFFLFAAVQGIFLSFILLRLGTKRPVSNRWLALLTLTFSLILIDYVGYWSAYNQDFPLLAGSYRWLTLLVGPFFLLYIQSINGRKWSGIQWLHFLPALLILVMVNGPYLLLPQAEKVAVLAQQAPFPSEFSWGFFNLFYTMMILVMGHLIAYGIAAWQYGRKQERMAPAHFRWQNTLLVLYGGFVLGYLSYYLLVSTPYFTLFYDYSISLAMAVFIYTIGYLGYFQPEIFRGEIFNALFLPEKYRNSTLTPGASQSILQRLTEYMDKEQPYLDNELRLPKLAEALNTTQHHLSQVINAEMGKSFFEFINDYRIEYAKQLLTDPDNAQTYVSDIAFLSGFNNKTSFYNAFKSATGSSPTAYRKRVVGSA